MTAPQRTQHRPLSLVPSFTPPGVERGTSRIVKTPSLCLDFSSHAGQVGYGSIMGILLDEMDCGNTIVSQARTHYKSGGGK